MSHGQISSVYVVSPMVGLYKQSSMARNKARKSKANAQTRVKGPKRPAEPRKKRSRARAKEVVLGPKQPRARPRPQPAQQLTGVETGVDSTSSVKKRRTRSSKSIALASFKSPPLLTGAAM